MASAAQAVVLVRDGQVVPCSVEAGAWLAQSPRGAYTTARTVGGSSVFELTNHVNRLASSVRLMLEADCKEGKPGAAELQQAYQHLGDPAQLRPLIVSSLSAAVAAYRQHTCQAQLAQHAQTPSKQSVVEGQHADNGDHRKGPSMQPPAAVGGHPASGLLGKPAGRTAVAVPAAAAPPAPPAAAAAAAAPTAATQASHPERPHQNGSAAVSDSAAEPPELKLTVLVTWEQEQGSHVWAHVSALPARPRPPVKAQVRGAPRSNALAKDSEWVRQRKALEAGKPADVNEVLLADPSGRVLEGSTSNFFAVVGGVVHTAGEGVLEGTVRAVALDVARREGIPVVLEAPRLQDIDLWEGAFISSTSRLVLPLDELAAPEWDPPLIKQWPRDGTVARLEQLVLQEIEAFSEPLR
ncbi:hypothetical protein N2152v2_008851 [Parachlorella kessleri]